MLEVEVPLHSSPFVNLQEDLAGKKVTIEFRGEKKQSVSGTFVKLAPHGLRAVGGARKGKSRVAATIACALART